MFYHEIMGFIIIVVVVVVVMLVMIKSDTACIARECYAFHHRLLCYNLKIVVDYDFIIFFLDLFI